MNLSDFQYIYHNHPQVKVFSDSLFNDASTIQLTGLHGSALSVVLSSVFSKGDFDRSFLMVLDDADAAAYAFNDLKQLLSPEQVYYFPSSYKKAIKLSQLDASNEILRTEVLNRIANHPAPLIVVTYPEAIVQKVVSAYGMKTRMLKLKAGESISIDFLAEMLHEYGFQRVDFVYEPGQFSIRGGIVDIFSFAYELPYRCDFFGDELESIRIFDIESQLSKERVSEVEIIPDLHKDKELTLEPLFHFIDKKTVVVFNNKRLVAGRLNQLYDEALIKANTPDRPLADLHATYITGDEFTELSKLFTSVEAGEKTVDKPTVTVSFRTSPQPIFHKNFDLVADNLKKGMMEEYQLFIMSDSVKQTDRIRVIFQDRGDEIIFNPLKGTLHEGFIDHDLKLFCYSDHQIFDRFHKFTLRTDKTRQGKVVMTLKELNQFQIGDYMVHVDHGIGTFGGLVKTNVNGKMQEMVKLIYRDEDIIFVSIHSLHRISKYKGKEGEPPKINKLGTGAWERLKERTKSKVKDIARELIKLYAKRKSEQGFQYTPDKIGRAHV